jgi:single-strand DNA-binding protein
MSVSYNKVIVIGNATRDPELKYLQSGTAVANIGLAINDRRKDGQGNWVDDPVFCDVTLFGRQAEIAGEYLHKGNPVLIEGRLKLDSWESKDGSKRTKLKVVGERMQLLGARQQNDEYHQPSPPGEGVDEPATPVEVNLDIPF